MCHILKSRVSIYEKSLAIIINLFEGGTRNQMVLSPQSGGYIILLCVMIKNVYIIIFIYFFVKKKR